MTGRNCVSSGTADSFNLLRVAGMALSDVVEQVVRRGWVGGCVGVEIGTPRVACHSHA